MTRGTKVASGRKRATAAVAARLDDVFPAGGSLAALADDHPLFNGSLRPDGRERIERARQHPGRADGAVADVLAVVLDAMTHHSLLIVAWDENDGSPGNQIPLI